MNLNTVLENAIVLMKKPIEDYNIKLNVNLDETIPNIMGDQNQLWQVFINLLMNAVESMPEGGMITIESGILKRRSENIQIYVKFVDAGQGIDKEALPRIFDPFFTTKSRGHGLGLAICYKIIDSHRARFEVESTVGEGSCFKIIFPVDSNQ